MKILICLLLPILFEAVSEGLYLRGLKVWSKQIQVLLIASWFVCWKMIPFEWNLLVIYVLIRFAVFNYLHNLAAGLSLNYIGKVSFVDRILALLCMNNKWMIYTGQVICLILAYYISIGKL